MITHSIDNKSLNNIDQYDQANDVDKNDNDNTDDRQDTIDHGEEEGQDSINDYEGNEDKQDFIDKFNSSDNLEKPDIIDNKSLDNIEQYDQANNVDKNDYDNTDNRQDTIDHGEDNARPRSINDYSNEEFLKDFESLLYGESQDKATNEIERDEKRIDNEDNTSIVDNDTKSDHIDNNREFKYTICVIEENPDNSKLSMKEYKTNDLNDVNQFRVRNNNNEFSREIKVYDSNIYDETEKGKIEEAINNVADNTIIDFDMQFHDDKLPVSMFDFTIEYHDNGKTEEYIRNNNNHFSSTHNEYEDKKLVKSEHYDSSENYTKIEITDTVGNRSFVEITQETPHDSVMFSGDEYSKDYLYYVIDNNDIILDLKEELCIDEYQGLYFNLQNEGALLDYTVHESISAEWEEYNRNSPVVKTTERTFEYTEEHYTDTRIQSDPQIAKETITEKTSPNHPNDFEKNSKIVTFDGVQEVTIKQSIGLTDGGVSFKETDETVKYTYHEDDRTDVTEKVTLDFEDGKLILEGTTREKINHDTGEKYTITEQLRDVTDPENPIELDPDINIDDYVETTLGYDNEDSYDDVEFG